jgi:GNAT superfamily N-acetyltransferase
MIVRTMHPHEIDSTMVLFNYYRDEAIEAMPKIADEYDENSMVQTVRTYSSNYEYCWFNLYEGQRPVGFVAGYLSECPWNVELITANIAFIFVLPSHRNMATFKQLLDRFTEWAKLCSAKEITAGDIGIDIERSRKLYEHFGFTPVLLMNKELNDE